MCESQQQLIGTCHTPHVNNTLKVTLTVVVEVQWAFAVERTEEEHGWEGEEEESEVEEKHYH